MKVHVEIAVEDDRKARLAAAALLPQIAARILQEGLVPLTLTAHDATATLTTERDMVMAADA